MRITIVGGGNIGTQFAVHCAEKGHEVIVFTSAPELFDGHLEVVDEIGRTTHEGDIAKVTSDSKAAFSNADMIMITFPANLMRLVTDDIYTYASSAAIIGVVPGNGGCECAFKKHIKRGNVFFGIERVPAIARLIQKGKTVKSTGYRDELHVAALPRNKAIMCAKIIEGIFDMKTTIIPSFLNLTMTPSNPILHTTRLKTIFKDWHEGITYDHLPLFYEEWDDESSELLIACDKEVQKICQNMPEFDLGYVKSLRCHYASSTVQEMTQKLRSIEAFKGIKTPAIEKDGRFIPDLHSRYFTADFSFGLSIIKQIGEFADVSTPYIDDVLSWYSGIAIEKEEFRFVDYGLKDRSELEEFYLHIN